MKFRSLAVSTVASVFFLCSVSASAGESPISLGEISQPPAGSGIDVAALRNVAEGAIKQIDTARVRRRVVVSLALTRARSEGPKAVCTVNAMLRDARTGTMIAIIEGGAQAEGASTELRNQVAHAAVRSAVRRIPTALAGSTESTVIAGN